MLIVFNVNIGGVFMGYRYTYESIVELIDNKFKGNIKLVSTKEEFNEERILQNKTALYVKLKYRCSCGEVYHRSLDCQKASPHGLCDSCRISKSASSRRLTHVEQLAIVKSKGLIYVSGDIFNHDTYFTVKCSNCGNNFKTCLRVIKNSEAEKMVCSGCQKEIQRNMYKTPFDEVKKTFEENGCVLLSTEDDYKNFKTKLKFIAKCGHVHETSYATFKKESYKKLCKECSRLANSGENNYNWKGGIYDREREKWNATYTAKKWRKDVLKRDNHTCRCCGQKQGKLNVHHLNGYGWCVEQRADVDNGATLCEDCHKLFHKIYGNKHNTAEQYYDFLKKYKKTG